MTHSPKKRVTKKDQLIRLLGTKLGSDIKSMSIKLGWQPHTTRAALSDLRKAGYEVACEKPATGGLAKYRILSAPASQQGKTATVSARGA
ncbi:hypothetical protein ROLI_033010 [Roseobacter fucihabitans]|uniref:DUF3489 domain-containing protein n=1 Tax=Roseobacter fucihabitans TaxID=1537242 RepID=A0ABZ2BVV2_9RHOB|nr:DUF3489 domain-containing protein [Roseobacter litoralis]MBC6968230.1 hypothetical protein [Roseobacter litoralis]